MKRLIIYSLLGNFQWLKSFSGLVLEISSNFYRKICDKFSFTKLEKRRRTASVRQLVQKLEQFIFLLFKANMKQNELFQKLEYWSFLLQKGSKMCSTGSKVKFFVMLFKMFKNKQFYFLATVIKLGIILVLKNNIENFCFFPFLEHPLAKLWHQKSKYCDLCFMFLLSVRDRIYDFWSIYSNLNFFINRHWNHHTGFYFKNIFCQNKVAKLSH